MADLLDQGLAFLETQRHRHMTKPVVYRRGADSVSLDATIGRTTFERVDQAGLVHSIESRDFLVRTEDLVIAGDTVLPLAGDRIFETAVNNQLHIYEVMALGGALTGGETPFRYSDPSRRSLRIHTKLVGKDPA